MKIKPLLFLLYGFMFPILLSGCAKLWSPVFSFGKKVNPVYYEKPAYYDNPHYLCSYKGPHIHDKKLGPISVPEEEPKTIQEKYRYPGMEENFKEMDAIVW